MRYRSGKFAAGTRRRAVSWWKVGWSMATEPLDRSRKLCLDLPEATEVAMKRGPTFRVEDKIFALYRTGDERKSLWCKVSEGSQAILIGTDPVTFFIPPYFGVKGWIGMRLDAKPDWQEVAVLVKRSYRLIAPKRLSATYRSLKHGE
jgi:predicted DNA-binding protein (MmcQ/YjbR family)